jgi:hypothetical protein
MRVIPNSLPTQALPAESEKGSSSMLAVLSDVATAVTSILVDCNNQL